LEGGGDPAPSPAPAEEEEGEIKIDESQQEEMCEEIRPDLSTLLDRDMM
jgi:hypothetical protein